MSNHVEMSEPATDLGPFFHGTKADLEPGDLPSNPTRSYRTRDPLRVVGEVLDWEPHASDVLQHMRDRLAELERLGIEAIND